ncbi:MAG: hypothetical protein A2Y03_04955 [Omnitrophica WOR_2 bacterium GWF2_38_59]|nr:MAG: hypothetical protein A2Y03_04955 [Omnitrophica WOR_2 bacterium GWF2_38_59]OGX48267.1 MAG: hypothetical protein A2243_10335 [Omnitrophica WOR_2 bacterium RIFOXYA2_FULL_38_17]OGX54876.1 MAG: hypothetical protein A2267_01285 [Omnitrophica WOR_2 bacterium RIFOXYA12_FULL_38_10]OGX59569.1 MAG: hypothetical protein A2447_11965 [Omnitrophica WOR_2 bacterium RIFOXYC2_FULL_38_12]OGX59960.1 MAG: hypothetical protein A2306_04500 [Omnitrophica WOR_2 bacterium RIFOXYB2_FULL_38_16]
MDFIKNYLKDLKNKLDELPIDKIEELAAILENARKKGKKIFISGNGGSASTASHFACDLGKGTVKDHHDIKETRFQVISLLDNMATYTAYSNDFGHDHVFSQQLCNLVQPGDIVIVITGSGNSKNIIKAVETAIERKAITIGFVGFDGGILKPMLDHYIHVYSDHYGIVEDVHLILAHMISYYLMK